VQKLQCSNQPTGNESNASDSSTLKGCLKGHHKPRLRQRYVTIAILRPHPAACAHVLPGHQRRRVDHFCLDRLCTTIDVPCYSACPADMPVISPVGGTGGPPLALMPRQLARGWTLVMVAAMARHYRWQVVAPEHRRRGPPRRGACTGKLVGWWARMS